MKPHPLQFIPGKYFIIGSIIICFAVFAGAVDLQDRSSSEKVISEKPAEADDPFTLAQYYFNSDDDPAGPYDLEKARYYYEEAITASSTQHIHAWYQLGRIDFLEGKFDAAIYKFEKQVQHFKDELPNVHYMLGLTYGYKARETNNQLDWQKGEEGFKKFLEFVPDSPWARTDLTWIYFAQGKYEAMLPVLEEGLEHHPLHPWLNNMYGLALMNTGSATSSREYFERALAEAEKLSAQEWGNAYPGNDPSSWGKGLSSFIDAIETNLALVSAS